MESNIVNIGTDVIFPHPKNPRKNLGDLSELAESIKKSGIRQNLTVIPGHWDAQGTWSDEGYTLIIGHRRFFAAKEAGLKKLPCIIVEGMTEKEQVSTMLEENMQREDLTIYEQAQGFQMMLDFGETEDSIAEKTGFSKKTIRHRLKIAELNPELLKKKELDESFQLTLTDLYELEKIEDIKTRNEILKNARDSRDLRWRAQCAVKEKEKQKKEKQIIKLLRELGVKAAPEGTSNQLYGDKWEIVKEIPFDKELPEKITLKEPDKLLYATKYNSVAVIKKAEKKKKAETPEEKRRKQRENNKKEIKAIIQEMNDRKKQFIQNIISGKIEAIKEVNELQEVLWDIIMETEPYLSASIFTEFFIGKPKYQCSKEESEEALKKKKSLKLLHQMLVVMNFAMDDIGDIYDWQGIYNVEIGQKLTKCYEILKRYGWSFKDEAEQRILDGTHDLYTKTEG